jgi:hypothetical protein
MALSRGYTRNDINMHKSAALAVLECAALTYQHDTRSSVINLYALNVILHLFFVTDNGG